MSAIPERDVSMSISSSWGHIDISIECTDPNHTGNFTYFYICYRYYIDLSYTTIVVGPICELVEAAVVSQDPDSNNRGKIMNDISNNNATFVNPHFRNDGILNKMDDSTWANKQDTSTIINGFNTMIDSSFTARIVDTNGAPIGYFDLYPASKIAYINVYDPYYDPSFSYPMEDTYSSVKEFNDALNKVFFTQSVTLYPNPLTSQFLHVKLGKTILTQLKTVDLLMPNGIILKTFTSNDLSSELIIDCSGLSNGEYILGFNGNKEEYATYSVNFLITR
jgi:hypothetical protein